MPVLMFESWVQNEIWIIDLSSTLVMGQHVNEFIQISSFKLRCETVSAIVLCVIVIKHVAFFTICAKLIMTFTFTS